MTDPASSIPVASGPALPERAVTQSLYPRQAKLEQWGVGPWLDEPDRVDFDFAELSCLILRNARSPDADGRIGMGGLCGYVAVPPGHPLHGVEYDAEPAYDLTAHGGLTYSGACNGHICHVPKSCARARRATKRGPR